jgi:ABC-type glutathione transport system ATPase component
MEDLKTPHQNPLAEGEGVDSGSLPEEERDLILELQGLGKTITLHVLDSSQIEPFKDISFEVSEGEFIAIVGASGSGKSSALVRARSSTSPRRPTVASSS